MDLTTTFHLLGQIDFDAGWRLQRCCARQVADAPRIIVLMCEHSGLVTVGRCGSRAHIRSTDRQLQRRGLAVRWVGRGGGCVLHAAGQLAVYPIVPLAAVGWSVGDFLRNLQSAVVHTLDRMNIRATVRPGGFAVCGRTGPLATFGIAVRQWISEHGFFLNVNPDMTDFALVDAIPPELAAPDEKTTMSCLVAERQGRVTMSEVRSLLVEQLAAAFPCDHYQMQTGHPWLTTATARS